MADFTVYGYQCCPVPTPVPGANSECIELNLKSLPEGRLIYDWIFCQRLVSIFTMRPSFIQR